MTGFSGKRAAELVGITYRQLDYWARTDMIRPSLADAKGSGSRRLYSYNDLLTLLLAKELLDAGIRLETVRTVVEQIRCLVDEVEAINVVVDRGSLVLALDDRELLEAVRNGRGVLNIVNLASCRNDLDARLHLVGAST